MKAYLCFCHIYKRTFRSYRDSLQYFRLATLHRQLIKKSLFSVLLHNTNKCPSIPLAHSVQMKENYENVKMLLSAFLYDQYNWEVIGDYKMVAFLVGLQQGFTKFPCYLCLWDSRTTNFYYNKRNWPPRSSYDIQTHNVKHTPLVEPKKCFYHLSTSNWASSSSL